MFQEPASFRALALHASQLNGDQTPQSVEYVKTMSSPAATLTGHRPDNNAPVYVVQIRGHFDGAFASVPAGHKRPSGNTMIIVIDARTGHITDDGITNRATNLTALGHPVTMTITR